MIIAIDGPAGSGKSTVARHIAKQLELDYYDTGAMYRCFTWFVVQNKVDPDDEKALFPLLEKFSFFIKEEAGKKKYFVNDTDITEAIRTPEITAIVSIVAAKQHVRTSLVKQQRDSVQKKNVVCEGRDMTTVVFPHADLKIFLTADTFIRAKRRLNEFIEKHPDKKDFSQEKILADIKKRDGLDTKRKISPLKKASDAFLLDTTNLTIDEASSIIIERFRKALHSQMKPFYRTILFLARSFLKFFYRTKVYGLNNLKPGGGLLTCNHVSFFDPMVVSTSCYEEIHFLARESLFKNIFLKKLITVLNTHPVSVNELNLQTFKKLVHVLKQNKKILVFPEGTRSQTDDIASLLPGIAALANFSQCKIFPVYVCGTYDVWSRKRKFPKFSGKIVCVFGSPIHYEDFASLEKKERTNAILHRIEFSLKNLKKWCEDGFQGDPP